MNGYLGATRRFAVDFDATTAGDIRPFKFRRAAPQFGGALAEFRAERGVTLNGSLPLLKVDDWLALARPARAAAHGGNAPAAATGAAYSPAPISTSRSSRCSASSSAARASTRGGVPTIGN